MTRHFYGIHLQSSKLSAAFDVIRYLSEPDAIRFSHITLRGPYSQPLSNYTLRELNKHRSQQWIVRLNGAGAFINENQNTVIIKIDLLDLADLFFKPDFGDGMPHLTLYDGCDAVFANSLLRLLYKFDFHEEVKVSQLRKISPKAPADSFAIMHNEFYNTFVEFLGHEPSAETVKSMSVDFKLTTIEQILSRNFTALFAKLNARPYTNPQLPLPLGDDEG